ncbi:MAG TPA: ABC transporter ATP-binding protein [Acidimicrobiales bacterium]|nr:ABC transporter ATP-binding protein [Acidimicrobiales bacterium]
MSEWVAAWRDGIRRRWTIVRLMPTISRPMAWSIGGVGLVSVVLPSAFTLATGGLVGAVPAAVEHGLDSGPGRHLLVLLAVVAGLFVAQQVVSPVLNVLVTSLGIRVNAVLRARVMRALLAPPGVRHLEDPAHQDTLALAKDVGPSQVPPGQAVQGLTELVMTRSRGVLAMVIVATMLPEVAFPMAAVHLVLRRTIRKDFLDTIKLIVGGTQTLRRSSYFRDVGLTPAAAKELRVFGLSGWVHDTYGFHWNATMADVWRERREQIRHTVGWLGLTAFAHFVAFLVVGRAAMRGELSLGQVAVLTGAIFEMESIGGVGNGDFGVEYGMAAFDAVPKLEELGRTEAAASTGRRSSDGLPVEAIRFEDVEFTYPGQDRPVFSHLDLEIRAGESLAVVGENGAGKTTLVKLLARLYDPQSGRITVDGVDLRDLDARAWQRRVGAIFQDFVHYPFTAQDNVAVGAAELLSDAAAVRDAAAKAGATAVVDKLDHGWDTVLSRLSTDGADLSGGEWQRIGLARALLAVRGGAGVLVLDEPTANLDVRAEAEIYDRFLELTGGLTTLLISHRFSTVRQADRIIVLEHGLVVEDGTHDTLLATAGRYAEMFRMQAARFAEDEVGA